VGSFSLAVGRCTCRCSVGTLVAERLLYIPSIGYCMLAGDAVRALVHRPAPLSLGSVRLRLATQATLLALLTLAFTHTRSARRVSQPLRQQQTGPGGCRLLTSEWAWALNRVLYSLGYW
jgi:hypothetical protein